MESIDAIFSILQFMEPKEILKTCRTNKTFKHICDNQSLWKRLYKSKYLDDGTNTIPESEYKKNYLKAFVEEERRHNIRVKVLEKAAKVTEYSLLYLYTLPDYKIDYYLKRMNRRHIFSLYEVYDADRPDLEEIFSEIKPELMVTLRKIVDKLKYNEDKNTFYDLVVKYAKNLRYYTFKDPDTLISTQLVITPYVYDPSRFDYENVNSDIIFILMNIYTNIHGEYSIDKATREMLLSDVGLNKEEAEYKESIIDGEQY